jgi:hypothetical protein
MYNDTTKEIVLENMGAENTKKDVWPSKRSGESALMMNCRLCVLTTIQVGRLEWGGHLVRMSDERAVKIEFLGKPDGRNQTERPKLRWLDCIENDLKSVGVKRWRKKAEGRSVMCCHCEGRTS